MTRRLYIHVGPRKTATSTIQRILAGHDNSIVLYPGVGHGRAAPGQVNGHHHLVREFFRENGSGDALMDSLAAECRRTERDIVLSCELLDSKDIGAFAQSLLDRLDSTLKVEILLACREHFSRAASWYKHRMRLRKLDEDRLPDQFLVECSADLCYAPIVRSLQPREFTITALNYHPSSDWVERFLKHIGFGSEQIPAVTSELVASGPKLLVAQLAVREVRSEERRRALRRAFKRMAATRVPSEFIFGPDAAEIAERQFAVDRKFLKDQFQIELVPPSPEARGSGLRIGKVEFADIAAVAKDFGADGQTVVDFASRFLR